MGPNLWARTKKSRLARGSTVPNCRVLKPAVRDVQFGLNRAPGQWQANPEAYFPFRPSRLVILLRNC